MGETERNMIPLRAGIIGLGIGEQHIGGYERHPACEVAALCDFSDEKLAAVGKRHPNVKKLSRQAEDVLLDPEIDVVSIASFDDAHFDQTLAALEADKHVFVEKPLCRSTKELRTIKQTWFKHRCLKLGSNLVLRTAAVYRWLKKKIEGGELGQIYAFDGDYLYGRLRKITEGWRKDVDGYSVMEGGGIHLVDLMMWLTGQRPVSVSAAGNRICSERTEFRYDDFVSATFQFESGLIGRITANFGCVHRHHHVVRVFGTKGTFVYDDQGPRLHTTREPSVAATMLDLPTLPASKGDLIPPFVQTILDGEDTREQMQHEFNLISACAGADRALGARHSLEIEYV